MSLRTELAAAVSRATGAAKHVGRPLVHRLRRWAQRAERMLRPPIPWNGEHHPALRPFKPWEGQADGTFLYDFLGARTDPRFRRLMRPDPRGPLRPPLPQPSATYFELVFVLEATQEAVPRGRPFTMLELGAGYGPWLVTAHRAKRALGGGPLRLIGVEMEPQHFRWMEQHLRDNGIDPAERSLLLAAVSDRDGEGLFVSDAAPDNEYGQALALREAAPAADGSLAARLLRSSPAEQREAARAGGSKGAVRVPCVGLGSLLDALGPVDLVHMDIQGEEWRALRGAGEALHRSVRRLLVATHSRRVHRRIRRMLLGAGWQPEWDWRVRRRERTPYGDVRFLDGLLAFVNPARTPPS